MCISTLILYPQLPSLMPTHWNIQGNVDSVMPKNIAAFLMPILTLGIYILFLVVPNFDPNKKKYALFQREWEIMQTGFIGFFAYLHFIILYISLNPGTQLLPLMFIGLGALFILMGNYMSKIRQNYFIGIKVPWTLANEDNWNKTHRYASWCFVAAGILTLAEAYFIWYAPFIIFGSLLLAGVLPTVYSFLLFKKQTSAMKYVYIGIIVVLAVMGFIRGISEEDDWICREGNWVKHGKPSTPVPSVECK